MVTVTLVITGLKAPFDPVEGVEVHIYDETGTTLVTTAVSDSSGQIIVLLADMTTYWVRFFKIGYSFDTKLCIFVDSTATSNTFDVSAEDLTEHPPSTVPELVRASGHLLNAAGAPVKGINLSFTLTGSPRLIAGRALLNSKTYIVTDERGWAETDLAKNAAYDVYVTGMDDEVIRVKTPTDCEAMDINDLLFPYVAAVEFGTTSVAMNVDDTVSTTAVVVLSSNVRTPVEYDNNDTFAAGYYINIENSDQSVVNHRLSEDGTLLLIGRAPGVATITASQKEGILAERYPEPPLSVTPITVIVT